MPDNNKFNKLREVGYAIGPACMFCKHASFPERSNWGACGLHTYEHKKHDNAKGGRGVSIHRAGTCPQFKVFVNWTAPLGAHREFFDGGSGEKTNGP